MNPVKAAELAWDKHVSNPQTVEALRKIGLTSNSELMIGFRALWMLGWIRREWEGGSAKCDQTTKGTN